MIFPKDMIATLSSETILQVMEGYDKICVKPAVDTCSGVGVNLFDLSNNVCECQIRRIAKYRNNSYFVGSPKSGMRSARLMSHFANIRKHNLDPVEYLCDVFRRIKKTAKDKLVDVLAHRWQLATVTAWA